MTAIDPVSARFRMETQYADAGLDADAIVATVLKALRINSVGVVEGARA